jgi:DNA-binding NarL/FixJ family response regulator
MPGTSTSTISVLIADDHPLLRAGLVAAVTRDKYCKVICECENGQIALEKVLDLKPDVAVLDMDMPRMSGLDVKRELTAHQSSTRVVILTLHRGWDLLYAALDLGIRGYVLKESASTDVLNAIQNVHRSGSFVSAALQPALIERAAHIRSSNVMDALTATELRVLRRVSNGLTTRDIAEELGIGGRTVENHRTSICSKLNIAGTNALTRYALEHLKEIQGYIQRQMPQ